jgi:large subunit ribosomal protein L29
MKMREVRELTDEELKTELDRLRRHLFDLRAQAVTEKLEDTSMIHKARRDIARILTAMKDRESSVQEAGREKA